MYNFTTVYFVFFLCTVYNEYICAVMVRTVCVINYNFYG